MNAATVSTMFQLVRFNWCDGHVSWR